MNRMFNTAKYLLVVLLLILSNTSQAKLIGDTFCFGMTGQGSPLSPSQTCQSDETEIIAIELVELQLTSVQPEPIQFDFFGCSLPLQQQCLIPESSTDAQQLQFDPFFPNPASDLDDGIWSLWFTDLDWVGMDSIITGLIIHQPEDLMRVSMLGPHEIHLNIEMSDITSALISDPRSPISLQVDLLTTHDVPEPKTLFLFAIAMITLIQSNKRIQLKSIKVSA